MDFTENITGFIALYTNCLPVSPDVHTCTVYLLLLQSRLPNSFRPVYSAVMVGVVICFTGFKSKAELHHLCCLAHLMGASIRMDMVPAVTHIVARTVNGSKYKVSIPMLANVWGVTCPVGLGMGSIIMSYRGGFIKGVWFIRSFSLPVMNGLPLLYTLCVPLQGIPFMRVWHYPYTHVSPPPGGSDPWYSHHEGVALPLYTCVPPSRWQ